MNAEDRELRNIVTRDTLVIIAVTSVIAWAFITVFTTETALDAFIGVSVICPMMASALLFMYFVGFPLLLKSGRSQ